MEEEEEERQRKRRGKCGVGRARVTGAVCGRKNGIEVHHYELLEPYAPDGFLSPSGGPSLLCNFENEDNDGEEGLPFPRRGGQPLEVF